VWAINIDNDNARKNSIIVIFMSNPSCSPKFASVIGLFLMNAIILMKSLLENKLHQNPSKSIFLNASKFSPKSPV